MLDRIVRGQVPDKHHIAFELDGRLLHEECLTREGFDGPYTILYHRERPHLAQVAPAAHGWEHPVEAERQPLARHHYHALQVPSSGPLVDARRPLLFNDDVILGIARPDQPDPVYVVDGEADEILFVMQGAGTLRTVFGDLRYGPKDYVFVPKGVAHRWIPDEGSEQVVLTMHCLGGAGLIPKWRNPVGQLRMDAPYCHRDFRGPVFEGPTDDGVRDVVVRRDGTWHGFRYDRPITDVVGYDGTIYPWVFPILAFQPRAGQVHLPPDWHGTFAARGALICSFVPRVVDFHERAIPCPYPHNSVDCDEFLFYVEGNFVSRKGVGPGSVSFHPYGVIHGPHPGAYEGSIGHTRTDELAVMVDTFKPMRPTPAAVAAEDASYHDSFRA